MRIRFCFQNLALIVYEKLVDNSMICITPQTLKFIKTWTLYVQYSPPPQGRRFFFVRFWPNPRPTPSYKNPSPRFFYTSKFFWSIVKVKIPLKDFQIRRNVVRTHREKRRPWRGGGGENIVPMFLIKKSLKTFFFPKHIPTFRMLRISRRGIYI